MSVVIKDVQKATHGFTAGPLVLPNFAVDPVDGDTIIVGYAVWSVPGYQQAPTDPSSNNYIRIGTDPSPSTAWQVGLWYAHNIVGGSSFAVTGHLSNTEYHTAIAWLISGNYTYNGDYAHAEHTNFASPLVSGVTSPAPTGEALFIALLSQSLAAATEGTGWNTTGVNGFTSTMKTNASLPSFTNIDLYSAYLVDTAAAHQADWAVSGNADYNALIASFSKVASRQTSDLWIE